MGANRIFRPLRRMGGLNHVLPVRDGFAGSDGGQAKERRIEHLAPVFFGFCSRRAVKSAMRLVQPEVPGAIAPPEPHRREQVDRAQKKEMVAMLHEVFSNTTSVVVSHNLGLTVAEMTDLRNRMNEAGGSVKVAKNRLAKLALEDTPKAGIADLLKGPTVLMYADDPVVPAKIVSEFAKKNKKIEILGGALESSVLDASGVKALADLPSLDEMRATLIGLVQSPAQKIASVLTAPGGQIARVLNAHAEKEQAA